MRQGRLVHLHGLETAGQGSVLLQVLAVLVQGRGPDRLQLAPGQHGLEDGGGVDGTFGRTGPDEGVQLVDEQDDVAPAPHLLNHLLQALLEVAPVTRTRYQSPQVQGVELLVPQGLGHVAGHDALAQALDDGRFAHARFADEDRVVLGPPGQYLHDPLDLAFAPDDGVELVLTGQLGQVAPELVQHGAAGRRSGAGVARRRGRLLLAGWVAGEQLDDLHTHSGQVGAQADQHLRPDTLAFADNAQEQVLGADVVVPELEGLSQ